ncbi:MAG: hypothetical protein Q9165_008218, partial [Trypethelium subeluteriae]
SSPRISTPTILLLNQKITIEALEVLRRKPLMLSWPFDTTSWSDDLFDHYVFDEYYINKFFSQPTLLGIRHIKLEVRAGWERLRYGWERIWCNWLLDLYEIMRYYRPESTRTIDFTFSCIGRYRRMTLSLTRPDEAYGYGLSWSPRFQGPSNRLNTVTDDDEA